MGSSRLAEFLRRTNKNRKKNFFLHLLASRLLLFSIREESRFVTAAGTRVVCGGGTAPQGKGWLNSVSGKERG